MKYEIFEHTFSADRMRKYVVACGGDTRRAMTLYRYNVKLSQELFALVGYYEVALRNAIDRQLKVRFGNDWLRDFILPGGIFFNDRRVEKTSKIIVKAYNELIRKGIYSHSKLLAAMEFGVWKYMFSNVQYAMTGFSLLNIFPHKPVSTRQQRYDNTYIFVELNYINNLRNRIAHHEPICFGQPVAIDTSYVLNRYARIMTLFNWMGIDGQTLMFGLDHVDIVCRKIANI